MPIIQITNTYKGAVLDIVKECIPEGFEARTLPANTDEALMEAVADADYILASGRLRIDENVLAHAPHLKMIQRTGVGLDTLDLEAIRKAGIPLYVNQGVNAQSVAEHTILLILACLRKLTLLDANSKRGIWQKQAQGITTYELSQKTVGVIGMGNIGKKVAGLLNAFGANVLYFDQYRPTPEEEKRLNIEFAEIDELFARSDVVTLHCALTDETRGIVNSRTLGLMKKGSMVVNTARGPLINEADLLDAIETEKIAFAGLDVHAEEPYSDHDALVCSERVIATPHIGGVTYDSFKAMIAGAMNNIAMFEKGELERIQNSRLV